MKVIEINCDYENGVWIDEFKARRLRKPKSCYDIEIFDYNNGETISIIGDENLNTISYFMFGDGFFIRLLNPSKKTIKEATEQVIKRTIDELESKKKKIEKQIEKLKEINV